MKTLKEMKSELMECVCGATVTTWTDGKERLTIAHYAPYPVICPGLKLKKGETTMKTLTLTQAKEVIKDLGRDGLENLISDLDEDIVAAGLSLGLSPDAIEDAYAGQFDSDEDFARDMADQLGSVDKNASWPNNCIDWEYAARELMYDYAEENGYYFRNS